MFRLSCAKKNLVVKSDKGVSEPFPLNYRNIYSLEEAIHKAEPERLAAEGLGLEFEDSPEPEGALLRLELLLQVIHINTVHHIYPRRSSKAPNRGEAALEDFDHHINGIRNIPYFPRLCSCQALTGYGDGLPAVLIAAGPSIDWELLGRLQGKALIIAVGRVFPRFVERGIVPDFLYVQETTDKGWEAILGPEDGPPANTTLISNPAGPIYKYAHRFGIAYKAWNYFTFEQDLLPRLEEAAPSSATGGYSIARLMGADPLIFMGCDCGRLLGSDEALPDIPRLNPMTQGGLVDERLTHDLMDGVVEYDGRRIWTKSDYIVCAQWLKAHFFKEALQRDQTLYDYSQTGLLSSSRLVSPVPKDFDAPAFRKRPLPVYRFPFDPSHHVRTLKKRYAYLAKRFASSASIPGSARSQPYNCIFTGFSDYDGERDSLDEKQRDIVRKRLDLLLEALARAIA